MRSPKVFPKPVEEPYICDVHTKLPNTRPPPLVRINAKQCILNHDDDIVLQKVEISVTSGYSMRPIDRRLFNRKMVFSTEHHSTEFLWNIVNITFRAFPVGIRLWCLRCVFAPNHIPFRLLPISPKSISPKIIFLSFRPFLAGVRLWRHRRVFAPYQDLFRTVEKT